MSVRKQSNPRAAIRTPSASERAFIAAPIASAGPIAVGSSPSVGHPHQNLDTFAPDLSGTPYRLCSVACSPASARGSDGRRSVSLSRYPARRRAFTLVELMVVIGILGLLAAIIIPAVSSLLDGNRTKTTLLTMQVLENAMAEFHWQGGTHTHVPMAEKDDRILAAVHLFGNLPPSPNSYFAIDPTKLDKIFEAQEPKNPKESDSEVGEKFERLLSILFNANITIAGDSVDFLGQYASIEGLYLFLAECCPAARAILEQLPGKSVTNLDRDWVVVDIPDRPTRRIDLLEVVDAWGRPLRYAVKPPLYDDEGRIVIPARWELRSAGPDGIFGELGSEDDDSDDVVLRGP